MVDQAESAPALASEISRRVGAILDAVEREATRLREEARADAAGYLEDARRQADALVAERRQRIAELSDELVTKSEAVVSRLEDAAPVREGFENLVRALANAAERLSYEGDPGTVAAYSPVASSATEPASRIDADASPARQAPASGSFVEERYPGFAEPSPGSRSSPDTASRRDDDARDVAIRMAAAGCSRAEVADHLELTLGPVVTSRTLDEVFGPPPR